MQIIISLEDILETNDEEANKPMAGDYFSEIAETMEFDVYVQFAEDILSSRFKAITTRYVITQIIIKYV